MTGRLNCPRSIGFLLCLIVLAPNARADDGKPWKDPANTPYLTKKVIEACDRADALAVPPQDLPTEADLAALKDCGSRALYYGIGMAKDFKAARQCAFKERANGDDLVIGGSSVLMMSYANGLGGPRNLDLALKFACSIGFAPAEIQGRVEHVLNLQSKPATGKIDFCDDVTSGFMAGHCAAIKTDIAAAKRAEAARALIGSWPPEQQAAYGALDKAAEAYFNSHADDEIDLSGTMRGAIALEEHDGMAKKLKAAIDGFEKGKLPAYSPAQFTDADKRLNEIYGTTMKKIGAGPGYTPPNMTKDGFRQTERLWLSYLEAWVKFAALRYPAVSADSFKTWLTLQRIDVIKDMPGN